MLKSSALQATFIASLLSGCSFNQPLDINQPDAAAVRLAQVAESIQKHANDLADIEAAKYGNPIKSVDTTHAPELEKIVSLGDDWRGPADKLINRLAALAGYQTRYIGQKPAGDVIVNIDTNFRRIVDMLHDTGSQAGKRATIVVKARTKMILVEYKPY